MEKLIQSQLAKMGCLKPEPWLMEALEQTVQEDIGKVIERKVTPDAVGKIVAAHYAKTFASVSESPAKSPGKATARA